MINFEIIIVDDESTDSTENIITEYISDKPRFKLIKPEKDFGETEVKLELLQMQLKLQTEKLF